MQLVYQEIHGKIDPHYHDQAIQFISLKELSTVYLYILPLLSYANA